MMSSWDGYRREQTRVYAWSPFTSNSAAKIDLQCLKQCYVNTPKNFLSEVFGDRTYLPGQLLILKILLLVYAPATLRTPGTWQLHKFLPSLPSSVRMAIFLSSVSSCFLYSTSQSPNLDPSSIKFSNQVWPHSSLQDSAPPTIYLGLCFDAFFPTQIWG